MNTPVAEKSAIPSDTTHHKGLQNPSDRNEPASKVPVISGHIWRRGRYSIVFHRRNLAITGSLIALILLLSGIALTQGRMSFTLPQVAETLLGLGDQGFRERIIIDIRLPRTLTALFAGAALGISGAIFQSVSRNALGSPDVIGFTTGAATGAIAQIVLFNGGTAEVALAAVTGGVLTAILVWVLSVKGGVVGGYRLILTGIGTGSILSALNGLMLVKGNLDNAIMANLWLAGSLHARTWEHALPVMLGVMLLLPLALISARQLSLTEMGDDMARQLGVHTERVRLSMIFCAVILAALATGAAGPIAFIALAAPQLVMRLSGAGTLPVFSAALMGGCLLLLADVITQLLPLQLTLPIGRMTGIVGGLYLIWLLTRSRNI